MRELSRLCQQKKPAHLPDAARNTHTPHTDRLCAVWPDGTPMGACAAVGGWGEEQVTMIT